MSVSATEGILASPDGLNIVYRSWRPSGAPRAVIAICPGFNAHSGRYAWVAEQLAGRGFAVHAVDLRGRGKSDGERFYVNDVADYVSDLAAMIKAAKTRDPGLRVFLLGHSAGGVISAVYTLDNQAELAGFICEDFAFQVPAPGFVISAIKGISHLAPHLPVLKLKNVDFSRDPQLVADMNNDPLIANETQPAITIAALARADERLMEEFPRITLPILIVHGTGDKVTIYHGSEYFHAHASSKDKTLKLYKDHYHDLLADTGKESVLADMIAWIDKHIASPGRAPA
jgi:alpha-beta hydrolase superfamily lysophospholipase